MSIIEDQATRTRYVDLPNIIESWVGGSMDIGASDILDFGCGEGLTALAFASRLGARSVAGVDIMPDPLRCLDRARAHLGMEALPENLDLRQIAPGEDFLPGRKFDLIYSWSAFEHVEQSLLESVIAQLRARLKPNGMLFIQVAPLYYSAEGGHLFHKISQPWGHLLNQDSAYFSALCSACDSKEETDALWSCYQWLNRLTADRLVELVQEAGLRIVRKHLTQDEYPLPEKLLRAYNKDALLTNQIVLLATPFA